VLGVDPGEHGAAALITAWPGCARPRLDELCPLFAKDALRALAAEADLVIVEAQQASPQMGRSSAFRLGQAYGSVLEAVEAGAVQSGAKVVKAFPTVWRGSYGLAGGKSGKADGIELTDTLLLGQEAAGLIERHDQADAVLLAWWGWRKHLLARAMQELQAAGES
jgi:hypothetical protein